MTTAPFSGVLEADSPHLRSLILRHCDQSFLEQAQAAYQLCWQHGGCTEVVPRAPGVSFNPRPARIGSLLISDAGLRSEPLLLTGILASAPAEALRSLSSGGVPGLDGAIFENAAKVSARETPIIPSLAPVYIACDLDILRHLHMSLDSPEERLHRARVIQNRLHGIDAPGRLRALFEHAVQRLTKPL